MLVVHPNQLYRVDLTVLYVLASADLSIAAFSYFVEKPIFLIEAVDPGAFLLFVLIGKLPHEAFRLESVLCELQTLTSRSDLFLLGFNLKTVLGDDAHLLQ